MVEEELWLEDKKRRQELEKRKESERAEREEELDLMSKSQRQAEELKHNITTILHRQGVPLITFTAVPAEFGFLFLSLCLPACLFVCECLSPVKCQPTNHPWYSQETS